MNRVTKYNENIESTSKDKSNPLTKCLSNLISAKAPINVNAM